MVKRELSPPASCVALSTTLCSRCVPRSGPGCDPTPLVYRRVSVWPHLSVYGRSTDYSDVLGNFDVYVDTDACPMGMETTYGGANPGASFSNYITASGATLIARNTESTHTASCPNPNNDVSGKRMRAHSMCACVGMWACVGMCGHMRMRWLCSRLYARTHPRRPCCGPPFSAENQ